MGEKKQIKVSLKTAVILFIALIAIIVISIILFNKYVISKKSSNNLSNIQNSSSNVAKYGKWINFVRNTIDFEWKDGKVVNHTLHRGKNCIEEMPVITNAEK